MKLFNKKQEQQWTFGPNKKVCYNPTVTTGDKEKEKMSYVGMMKSSQGMVAFGDSRSVGKGKDGRFYVVSDEITKVFKGDDILIVTCGANQYLVDGGKPTPIESLIKTALETEYNYVDDLMLYLRDKLYHSSIALNAEYQFVIGYVIRSNNNKESKYIMRKYTIGPGFYNADFIDSPFIHRGEDIFTIGAMSVLSDATINQMEYAAKRAVENAIDISKHLYDDLAVDVQFIGGKVKIETLK